MSTVEKRRWKLTVERILPCLELSRASSHVFLMVIKCWFDEALYVRYSLMVLLLGSLASKHTVLSLWLSLSLIPELHGASCGSSTSAGSLESPVWGCYLLLLSQLGYCRGLCWVQSVVPFDGPPFCLFAATSVRSFIFAWCKTLTHSKNT